MRSAVAGNRHPAPSPAAVAARMVDVTKTHNLLVDNDTW